MIVTNPATRKTLKVCHYFALTLILLYSLVPFYWAILSSLRAGADLFSTDLLPTHLTLQNYQNIFSSAHGNSFLLNMVNSLLVAITVVCFSLLISVTASFALSRFRFKGQALLMLVILGVSMFPQVAVLAGLLQIVRSIGLYNNLWALIFSYCIFILPFTIWVLTTYMRELPIEIEESARMDGANNWQIVYKIFLPIMWPAMVTTGLLAFIAAWNEFLFALTFTLTNDKRTVPVAISMLSGASRHDLPWGNIMAASVTVTIPLIILVLIFQRYIVSGLTAGAVKG